MEAVRNEPASQTAPQAAPVTELPVKKSSRGPFLILGVIAVVVVGSIAAHAVLTAGQEDTDDAQVESDVVPISPRVGGMVLHVRVEDNQPVKKGDVILELDEIDFQERVKQAQAELETAKAQAVAADAQADVVQASAKGGFSSAQAAVSGSSVQVGSADAQIASAKAGLQRAQSDLRKAQIDISRAKELRAANAVPQSQLDIAQAAFDSATAAVEQAKANLDAASEGKRVAQARVEELRGRLDQSAPIAAQIAAARAQAALAHSKVRSAEVALDIANLQLSYTKVMAPADGTVSKVTSREGAMLQPGQAVAELVPSATYLVANFKETQVGTMRPGDPVDISIDAYSGRKLSGTVVSLSGGTGARFSMLPPDNASGNFVKVVQRVPVRIAWATTPDVAMRAGLSADVTVHTRR